MIIEKYNCYNIIVLYWYKIGRYYTTTPNPILFLKLYIFLPSRLYKKYKRIPSRLYKINKRTILYTLSIMQKIQKGL